MNPLKSYITEYLSSPDDVRVTIDGKFYKLNPYQTNAYPFAWGIKGDVSLVTCKLNAPDWKRVHAVLFADKFGEELPAREEITHQGRVWTGPVNIVVFWEEMNAEQSVEATKELIEKWNKKFSKRKLELQKTYVIVGGEVVKVTDNDYNKNIKDKSKEEAYALHLSDYNTKRNKLSKYLSDRSEHQALKLGKITQAEYNFRRYQESYFLNMKSLKEYIKESYSDPVQNEVQPDFVYHGFDLEKIHNAIDGAGEYDLKYYNIGNPEQGEQLTCTDEENNDCFFSIEPDNNKEYILWTEYQWIYDIITELGYDNVQMA